MVSSLANPQTLNRYTYCLNNPLKYIDPSGHQGEGLPPPYKEGALSWTPEDGWLTGIGGEWVRISGEAVDTMLSIFREIRESTADITWSEFASVILPPIVPQGYSPKEVPTNLWALRPFTTGSRNYMWSIQRQYSREKDIAGQWPMETRLTLTRVIETDFTGARQFAADALNVTADTLEFLGPGLSNVPPEYVLAVAGLAALAGPEAVLAVGGYYVIVAYGPDYLRILANLVEPE